MKHGLNFGTIDASLVNFNRKAARSHDCYQTMSIDTMLIYYDEGYFKIITMNSEEYLTSKQLKLEWITSNEMLKKHSIELTPEQQEAVYNAQFEKVIEFYPKLKGINFTLSNSRTVVYPKNTIFE